MKNYAFLIVMAFIGFSVSTQSALGQVKAKAGSEESFKVELQKSKYYLIEPISLKFSGKLRLPRGSLCISDIEDGVVVTVTFNGEQKIYRGIHATITLHGFGMELLPKGLNFSAVLATPPAGEKAPVHRSPQQQAVKLADIGRQPFEFFSIIDTVKHLFPNAGNYQIQFAIPGKASDVINVKIEMPKGGKDLEAFNFLKRFENPLTFYWIWKEENGIAMLESFVANYGDTPYGDIPRSKLAFVYNAKGQYAKARIEFKKLKSCKNKAISEEAVKMLSDLAREGR